MAAKSKISTPSDCTAATNRCTCSSPPPPPSHVPFAKRWEGGSSHCGHGGLEEMALSGFPSWSTHLHQQPLCLFSVGTGSVPQLALLLLETSPPPLRLGPKRFPNINLCGLKFPQLILKPCPKCPYLLSWLPELGYHPVAHLGGYPQKTERPHAIFPNGLLQRGHREGGGGRTPNLSTLSRARLLVMAALVCQASPRLGRNLAWKATRCLLFLVHRCRRILGHGKGGGNTVIPRSGHRSRRYCRQVCW